MPSVAVGETFTWERTFTDEEVLAFARISGDTGAHHLIRDPEGRLLVHGLLVATIPTKIGGDVDFIARAMNFEFLRPVFTGDLVRCRATVTEAEPEQRRLRVGFDVVCVNQHSKEVLRLLATGIIRTGAPATGS